ncbi:MAG: hypothetical protein QOF33_876 [Thermomicrobiales bacterium]|jgi:hypothetical protein|nr:hypothetical protein [Thermomicrobiales bacterium]
MTVTLLALATGSSTVATEGASPTSTSSRLADLDYPELRLVATDEGAEAPREVAAGRYLVVLENRGTPGGPAALSDVQFIRLPPGIRVRT